MTTRLLKGLGGQVIAGHRPRTPVKGDANVAQIATQGVPQKEEHVAAHKVTAQLDPRDLDLFLKARAGDKQKGLIKSLKRALDSGRTENTHAAAQVQALQRSLTQTVYELSAIYADGRVTEGEITQLTRAQAKLANILALASPDVLNLLPRSTRERLHDTLFQPVAILHAAAARRGDRLLGAVEGRDGAALRERLAHPTPTYALFSPADEARKGKPIVTASRFKAGDLVAVPRSDGRSSLGVVVENLGDKLRCELYDEKTGLFGVTTLDQSDILRSNPLKIGDYLEVDDKQIWVKGVGKDGRLEAVMKAAGSSKLTTLGGDEFAHVVTQATAQYRYAAALEQLPGMSALPEVTRRLARFAVDVGPSDKVFGRLSMAIMKALDEPAKRLGTAVDQQAHALTKLLREEPAHLHSVIPNFRTDRPTALVANYNPVYGAGAHPLMRMLPGAQLDGHVVHRREFEYDTPRGKVRHALDIVMPNPPPALEPGKQHAALTEIVYNLAKLPYDSIKEIKNVVANPNAAPDDAYWQKEFNDPTHSAYMSADKRARTLTIYPAHRFLEMELSLAHEVGHFIGSDKLGFPGDARWNAWDQAVKTDNLSVSRYAKNNLDEDFAETYSLYTMTKDTPAHAKYRGLMPQRFALLDRLTS